VSARRLDARAELECARSARQRCWNGAWGAMAPVVAGHASDCDKADQRGVILSRDGTTLTVQRRSLRSERGMDVAPRESGRRSVAMSAAPAIMAGGGMRFA
jgi:hypothetical protein